MKTKLQKFKQRNQKRNSHLYLPGLVEGYDYVACPISGERLSMIKDNYITNILGIEVVKYPKVQRVCQKRKENIKIGLKEIDPMTGLTKYQLSQVKAREVLSEVDTDGLRGYDRKGQKTRATHMSKIDELGRNGYSRLATKAILKGNSTKAKNGSISLDRNEFSRYKLIVTYLTEKHRSEITTGFVTGLAGKEGARHIDHMFSILKGYQQKISPFLIGHRNNLQMLPWEKNLAKHSECSIELDDLLERGSCTLAQSDLEYELILQIIADDIQNNTLPNAAFLLERYHEASIRS